MTKDEKILCGILVLLLVVSCAGCGIVRIDEKKVEEDMEDVFRNLLISVQEGDKERFKNFFAEDATKQYDYATGRDYVFEKYQGELISVTMNGIGSTGTTFVPGETIHYAHVVAFVVTSEMEYKVVAEVYTHYESKYPNDPYKIRKFSLLKKLENGKYESGVGTNLRYGIFYPGWLGVENIEGNESKLYDRLSVIYSEYDRVEIVTYFYVRDAEDHIDTFCLIDTGDRLDLRSVITYNGGLSFDFILLLEDMQIPYDYSVTSTVGDREISFYVSDKQLNSSEYKEVIEFSHGNLNYWFGIKSIDCFD